MEHKNEENRPNPEQFEFNELRVENQEIERYKEIQCEIQKDLLHDTKLLWLKNPWIYLTLFFLIIALGSIFLQFLGYLNWFIVGIAHLAYFGILSLSQKFGKYFRKEWIREWVIKTRESGKYPDEVWSMPIKRKTKEDYRKISKTVWREFKTTAWLWVMIGSGAILFIVLIMLPVFFMGFFENNLALIMLVLFSPFLVVLFLSLSKYTKIRQKHELEF